MPVKRRRISQLSEQTKSRKLLRHETETAYPDDVQKAAKIQTPRKQSEPVRRADSTNQAVPGQPQSPIKLKNGSKTMSYRILLFTLLIPSAVTSSMMEPDTKAARQLKSTTTKWQIQNGRYCRDQQDRAEAACNKICAPEKITQKNITHDCGIELICDCALPQK